MLKIIHGIETFIIIHNFQMYLKSIMNTKLKFETSNKEAIYNFIKIYNTDILNILTNKIKNDYFRKYIKIHLFSLHCAQRIQL